MKVMQDEELDRLLARAAASPPTPAPALLERVLANAWAEQDRLRSVDRPTDRSATRRQTGRVPVLDWLAGAFGGPPMLAGVFSAAFAGAAIGYLEPGMLDMLTGGDAELVDLFPEVDFLTTEG